MKYLHASKRKKQEVEVKVLVHFTCKEILVIKVKGTSYSYYKECAEKQKNVFELNGTFP